MIFDHKQEDDPRRYRIVKAGEKVTCDGRGNGDLNLSRALGENDEQLMTYQKQKILRSINPEIRDRILCVGGRLPNAEDLGERARHNCIIPKESFLVNIIITDFHGKLYHAGTIMTYATVTGRFWIPHLRSAVRSMLCKYVPCRQFSNYKLKPLMGTLPAERVSKSFPFFM